MAEYFIKSREADQGVDGHSEPARDIVAEAETGGLKTPVKTSDNEKDKRNLVDIHTIN